MIFGFGKKKRPEATFKDRVTEFWEWYVTAADRLYNDVKAGRSESLVSEVDAIAKKTLPNLAWVFGPGENEGLSFTVSGEGLVHKQLLAEYWRSRAPDIPKWTFHASRQPSSPERLKDIAIGIGDYARVDVENCLIKTTVDAETKLIHIVAWHSAFLNLPEADRIQIIFLLLDETLGEFGTQTWLGEIKVEPVTAGEGVRKLIEMPAFIEHVSKYHEWDPTSPLQSYSVYELSNQNKSPRGDTLVGSTCIPKLMFELLENNGKLTEDPLAGTGAEFAYVAIDGSVFPDGRQADVRGNIEDAISDDLASLWSGRTLGGAFGLKQSYIDLLLFDGDNSWNIVQETLAKLQLQGRSKISSFV